MKKIILALTAATLAVGLSACTVEETDAKVVGENIDTAAEMFEVNRRVVALNTITDKYIWDISGRCNITYKGSDGVNRAIVECKVADGEGADAYRRNSITLADNVTLSSEMLEPMEASAYHYRVVYKPQTIIPDVDFRGSTKDIPKIQK